jgi:hypothetical protein
MTTKVVVSVIDYIMFMFCSIFLILDKFYCSSALSVLRSVVLCRSTFVVSEMFSCSFPKVRQSLCV